MKHFNSSLVALAAFTPFFAAACSDTPAANAPSTPTVAGGNPQAGAPQIGMSDMPSSVRPGDLPDASRGTMNASAQGSYAQGLQAFANGDLATARAKFGEAAQADSRAHQAYYSLGVVQERLKDPGAAQSYRQSFTIVPTYEPAIIAYAMLQAKRGQLGDAERTLTEKRTQMPKSAAVAATLAEVKSLQKDTGSAQRIAQEALKINPDYRPAMVVIARDHYRNRRLDLALYALQAILDGFPDQNGSVADNPPRDRDNPEALLLRGLIYREQGQRKLAIEQFRTAIARRPDLVEARVQYGTFLLEAGNAEEALPVLERALRYDADNVAAHLNIGDAYRLLGRYADAKREFEWVMSKDSTLPQVHYDLGLLYLFAPSIPGMTPQQQITAAQTSLKRFQELRKKGDEKDDSEELIQRAKLKEGELKAATAAAQPVAPVPATSAAAGAAKPGAPGAPKPAAPPQPQPQPQPQPPPPGKK
jgi:tetratricopeptide (TPR) repeat protein